MCRCLNSGVYLCKGTCVTVYSVPVYTYMCIGTLLCGIGNDLYTGIVMIMSGLLMCIGSVALKLLELFLPTVMYV